MQLTELQLKMLSGTSRETCQKKKEHVEAPDKADEEFKTQNKIREGSIRRKDGLENQLGRLGRMRLTVGGNVTHWIPTSGK